jgi:uncharacterized protein
VSPTTVDADRVTSSPAATTTTSPVTRLLLASIHLYQLARAGRPTGCRYLPTCSAYAEEAIRLYGPVRGSRLALARLGRCRPGGGHGVDPVPDRSAPCRP